MPVAEGIERGGPALPRSIGRELAARLGLATGARPFADPAFAGAILLGLAGFATLRRFGGAATPIEVGALTILGFVLVQPALEELFFRGLVQGALLRTRAGAAALGSLTGANVMTSALFVLAHVGAHPLPWAAAVFAPSLVFGLLRDRTGSVLPAIAIHVLYNAGYLAALGTGGPA